MTRFNATPKKRHARPEEQMYEGFCQEMALRYPKHIDYLSRFEHGGYVIGWAEINARKRTLLRSGIPDYGLFVRNKSHTMLWVEFKVKGNRMSPKQKDIAVMLTKAGGKHVVCWSAEEGIEEVKQYLEDL